MPEDRTGARDAADGESPARLLPQGEGFRFVDAVLARTPVSIVTARAWTADDAIIRAHFTDGPHVVPGVLMAEQVAQSALLMARLEGTVHSNRAIVLAQLKCDFISPAAAPCTVEAEVRFLAGGTSYVSFEGVCRVGGADVARIKGLGVMSE